MGPLTDALTLLIVVAGAAALAVASLGVAAQIVDRHARMAEVHAEVLRIRRSRKRRT